MRHALLTLLIATLLPSASACEPGTPQPPVQIRMRAYTEAARQCQRDADCGVANALWSCKTGCTQFPWAWNRRAYVRINSAVRSFCSWMEYRLWRKCGDFPATVVSEIDPHAVCLDGRCVLRYRPRRPPVARKYFDWIHPQQLNAGLDLGDLAPLDEPTSPDKPTRRVLAWLRAVAAGELDRSARAVEPAWRYGTGTLIFHLWPLLEGRRIGLEGRVVRVARARMLGRTEATLRVDLEQAGEASVSIFLAPGVVPPKRNQWIRAWADVVVDADRIQPLYSENPNPGKPSLLFVILDTDEFVALDNAAWERIPPRPTEPVLEPELEPEL